MDPTVVERASLTVALLNRHPYSPGHVLIAPARHVADPTDLRDDEAAAVFAALQRALVASRRAMNPAGFNIGFNLGSSAGASVAHLHLHAVPRWEGDTNFMPVIGGVKVLPEALEDTAANLRKGYAATAQAGQTL